MDLRQPFHNQKHVGTLWRLAVVGSGIICCLVTAGLAFGFSALMPCLLKAGAFVKECSGLTAMFTLASSLLNIFTLPAGAMLDKLGPRTTAAIFGSLAAAGCWLFALGPENDTNYIIGFLALSLSGPYLFNCTMSFGGNYFPAYAGLITAALVGCFDASSADFAILAHMIKGGLPLAAAFRLLALLVALCTITTLAWPDKPVESAQEGERQELVKQNLWQICRRVDFWLLAYTASVSMLCLNFFIATAYPQLLSLGISETHAENLNSKFAWMLPAGGIVFAPFIGAIIDRLGVATGYIALNCAYLAFTLLLMVYATGANDSFATAAFACFSFCRPLFYTLNPVFCSRQFGLSNFGTSFGFILTTAGVCNLLVQPLASLGSVHGFPLITGVLGLLQFSTIIFPMWTLRRADERERSTLSGMDA